VSDCDDVLLRVLLGATPDGPDLRHVESCARCAREVPQARALGRGLAAYAVPEPPRGLSARVVAAARPILARARRPAFAPLARALGAALLPLPVIVAANVVALRAAHHALGLVLPAALTSYLVFHWVALIVLLLGTTYAAVPLLAARQAAALEESHA
jgi:hypothetical protein